MVAVGSVASERVRSERYVREGGKWGIGTANEPPAKPIEYYARYNFRIGAGGQLEPTYTPDTRWQMALEDLGDMLFKPETQQLMDLVRFGTCIDRHGSLRMQVDAFVMM